MLKIVNKLLDPIYDFVENGRFEKKYEYIRVAIVTLICGAIVAHMTNHTGKLYDNSEYFMRTIIYSFLLFLYWIITEAARITYKKPKR